jgi:hypothetical protein
MIRDLLMTALAISGVTAAVAWLLGSALLANVRRPRRRPLPGGSEAGRSLTRDDFDLVA